MKIEVEINQVVQDLTALFRINENHESAFKSLRSGKKFLINKRQYERLEVIEMLQAYFTDKVIKNGYLGVSPMTLVFTVFEVFEGDPK
jgi:hypothetical protein